MSILFISLSLQKIRLCCDSACGPRRSKLCVCGAAREGLLGVYPSGVSASKPHFANLAKTA